MQLIQFALRQTIVIKIEKTTEYEKDIIITCSSYAFGQRGAHGAQRHRHTPRTAVVDDTKADNGIEAYSDTSSTVQPIDTTAYDATTDADDINDSNRFDPSRFSDPFSWFAFLAHRVLLA